MTDAHFHRGGYATYLATGGRETRFHGLHPWQAEAGAGVDLDALRAQLAADASAGVGEIGLDRLRTKTVSEAQRACFAAQLALAAELRRPVVLHGAKCWGEVVAACRPYRGRIPAFLFHGFSRSAGLLPEIAALNGFVSVGPALLNDHAVNYHALARALPEAILLVETDADYAASPDAPRAAARQLAQILARLAALRGEGDVAALEARIDANAARFLAGGATRRGESADPPPEARP